MARRRANRSRAASAGPNEFPQRQPVDANRHPVLISFRYCQVGSDLCLSRCTRSETVQYLSLIKRLEQLTWNQAGQSDGTRLHRCDPTGLKQPLPQEVSPDLTMYYARANQSLRLFGVRSERTFFVVWFDREHRVYPG